MDRHKASIIARDAWAHLSGEGRWTISESDPFGEGMWLVVLADEREERFATVVLDEDGRAEVVSLEQ
jgi:hypothetical protein